jgi:K+-sensing histidine kinase KdpD
MLKIINHSDLFEKERQQSLMDELEKLSGSTWHLLQNLLEWSRNQLNTITISKSRINIHDIVVQNVELLDPMAKTKSISIDYSKSENLECYADYRIVDTILRNVISNAIKFTPVNGNVKIYSETNGKYTILKIKDNGIGMDDEKIKSLFEKKNFTTSFGTEGEKGAGLGLLLCRNFIEKINGKFEMISTVSNGTEVIISLPIELQI